MIDDSEYDYLLLCLCVHACVTMSVSVCDVVCTCILSYNNYLQSHEPSMMYDNVNPL